MGRPLEEPGHHQGAGPWVGKSCSLVQLMGSWVFLPASNFTGQGGLSSSACPGKGESAWEPVELREPAAYRPRPSWVETGSAGEWGSESFQRGPASREVPAAGRSATSFPPWFSAGWASAQNSRKQLSACCFIGRIYPSQGAEVRFHPLQIKAISVIPLGTRLALWTHWTRGGIARGPNSFIPRTL